MFLYYIHSSEIESDSPLGSISPSSSQSSVDYPDEVLTEEELDNPKEWDRIKENFQDYDLQDQQRILKKAIQQGEKDFVLEHFFNNQYDFEELLITALASDKENIIDSVVKGWLARSNWVKLGQHFLSFSPKLKYRIWNKAVAEENREFLRAHWDEMNPSSHQAQRRTRDIPNRECGLPPPFPKLEVDEKVEVSQYKKEWRQFNQQ